MCIKGFLATGKFFHPYCWHIINISPWMSWWASLPPFFSSVEFSVILKVRKDFWDIKAARMSVFLSTMMNGDKSCILVPCGSDISMKNGLIMNWKRNISIGIWCLELCWTEEAAKLWGLGNYVFWENTNKRITWWTPVTLVESSSVMLLSI